MSTTVDWIWLSLALGIASPAAQIVLTRELDPQELYQMSLQELMQAEYFSPSLCKKLKHNQQALLQKAQRILEHCREKGYRVITVRDSVYPLQLLSLQEPPLVLYALGNSQLLGRLHDLPVLTVVGTRSASDYGRQAATDLSGSLARSGMIIVSGLAVGIDACAHAAALKAGKPTIAVLWLGCQLSGSKPAASPADIGARRNPAHRAGAVSLSVGRIFPGTKSPARRNCTGGAGGAGSCPQRRAHHRKPRFGAGQGCLCSPIPYL